LDMDTLILMEPVLLARGPLKLSLKPRQKLTLLSSMEDMATLVLDILDLDMLA